ncbi:uncharacterized protein FOMMEDRAFT_150980 [Fomitiporia mediterranea MF3/22]|uniref:uncharacterized protein n=1 Tax=Fomitiporia mediterranea (strain MF3/22) TaxID=694068 RepID=UPI000440956C|nr:uncharacterized protein FOMMEDRAFT_150980 [Fomitiporia mediterranea MF3/22]EJD08244.1 hypothetical protein FOMMEDRAFT_150980 [Fomitiporia mediterranea MF3/22]
MRQWYILSALLWANNCFRGRSAPASSPVYTSTDINVHGTTNSRQFHLQSYAFELDFMLVLPMAPDSQVPPIGSMGGNTLALSFTHPQNARRSSQRQVGRSSMPGYSSRPLIEGFYGERPVY